MISQIRGTLTAKALDRVEILTAGGVGYEIAIPLSAYEALPTIGEEAALHVQLVVRDDAWLLFGFMTPLEKQLFATLLGANGIGPGLALGMLSALSAERLVRAIREKDITTLQGVPRVGRKKAERLALDLADKLDGLHLETPAGMPRAEGAAAEDAVRALVSLGYSTADAEKAVRTALDEGGRGRTAPDLIRMALSKVGGSAR
ncbi:MAG TPA: Holliday junction branch migration protein RuvA [Gemmatimonadaceae bacterium]|nr:Holliday junction branch migration protein RuvA [Gemmatimonadaceae bacterium]